MIFRRRRPNAVDGYFLSLIKKYSRPFAIIVDSHCNTFLRFLAYSCRSWQVFGRSKAGAKNMKKH